MLFIWCLYAILEGYREGNYWHIKPKSRSGRNYYEHFLWSMQRFTVLLLVFIHSGWQTGLSCILVFPFLHDGFYYTRRNELDSRIYSRMVFAQSKTSTAVLTKYFTPIVRTTLAIVGIFYYLYWKLQFDFLF